LFVGVAESERAKERECRSGSSRSPAGVSWRKGRERREKEIEMD
jgi:hypothetical protein